jgi:hypothetical protein
MLKSPFGKRGDLGEFGLHGKPNHLFGAVVIRVMQEGG